MLQSGINALPFTPKLLTSQQLPDVAPWRQTRAPRFVEQDGCWGGHNAERIMMTPDTFKELCMLSNTAKGREVRGFYIKMEKVVKQFLRDKAGPRHGGGPPAGRQGRSRGGQDRR
jgi:hypothetical protein